MRRRLPTAVILVAGLAAVVIALAWLSGSSPEKAPKRRKPFRETLLCTLGPEAIRSTLVASPDGWHVAYVAKRGEQRLVVVDGAEGPA